MQGPASIQELANDTTPFGTELAEQVAARLEEGSSIGVRRAGYCGMGMEKDEYGDYMYGELYTGIIQKPLCFRTREAFVDWLAQQSTASLARLDAEDPRKRGFLVITRERLLAFVL
ncbi:hypothetical protein [Chitinophaga sp.]|uniref:hypothetical protein n=1 Tax=Chitinophaga sp. TaxID=1869181 RepID=UPI002FDEC252